MSECKHRWLRFSKGSDTPTKVGLLLAHWKILVRCRSCPVAQWRSSRVPDLWLTGREFESQPPHCRVQLWASCLHTCASVTKKYNLVPANGRWCLAAGKVTVGLASHWPRLTDINGSPPMRSRRGRGRWTPPLYSLLWSMVDFTLLLPFLLPPMTHMTISWSGTQARWVQVSHLNHHATAAP